jgi:hypothetical protein
MLRANNLQSAEFAANAETTNRALWFKRNAAIEAFWTHARNLIKFLTRPKSKAIDSMTSYQTADLCSAAIGDAIR